MDGDPLQAHIDRLGAMPAGWAARKVATPADHQAESLAFLHAAHPAGIAPNMGVLPAVEDEGFVRVPAGGYDGLIHWRGTGGGLLHLHAPGRAVDLFDRIHGLAIDLPGHGLSDGWPAAPPTDPAAWQAVIAAVVDRFDCTGVRHAALPSGDPDRLFPDLAADRFGGYLTRAWAIVRAGHLFDPWYDASAATARDFAPEALAPDRLAREHRALIRASAARHYLVAMRSLQGES